VFAMGGVKVKDIAVDHEGLMVSEGRRLAPKARAAFVTPARQYPTGVTMPLARRLELLEWAREAGAIIIEDDYDSEYRYVGRPLPALMSLGATLDGTARVIYSGTFSKVFSPIVRLGFIVVPQEMVDGFREARANHGAPPSLMVQPALASFIESGQFAVHIRRMRRIYAARRKALIDALAPGDGHLFHLDASPSGLMLLLRLKPTSSDEKMAARLRQQGVETVTLSSHYCGAQKQQGLLLSFAGFREAELHSAARIVLDILAHS
jgi:GntR family transcriptional regulator / MocR family aminotransferase